MPADLPASVPTSAGHLRKMFRPNSPERYVIDQIEEIREETWTSDRAKRHVLAGMVLALELIALRRKT